MVANFHEVLNNTAPFYRGLKKETNAFARDILDLKILRAFEFPGKYYDFELNLDWPQFMTDTEFGQKILEKPSTSKLPKIKFR